MLSKIKAKSRRFKSVFDHVNLHSQERIFVYQRKSAVDVYTTRLEARTQTIQKERGCWTRRLIKLIKPWMERKHGVVDYYLTHVLIVLFFITGRHSHKSAPTAR